MGAKLVRQTKEIFAEYSRMRDNGLDAKAALNVLRYHIEVLSKPDREALANMMRAREAELAATAPAPTPPTMVSASPFSAKPPAAAPETSSPPASAPRPQKINSIKPIGAASNGNAPTNNNESDAAVTIAPNIPNFAPPPVAPAPDDVV